MTPGLKPRQSWAKPLGKVRQGPRGPHRWVKTRAKFGNSGVGNLRNDPETRLGTRSPNSAELRGSMVSVS